MVWLLLVLACGGEDMAPWWGVDVGYDGPLRFDTAEDTDTEEPVDLSDQKTMQGALEQTGTGAEADIRFRYVADKAVLCDVRYTSTKIRQVSCADCTIAFALYLDQEELIDDGGACDEEGWTGRSGEPVYVGVDMQKNSYHCTDGCADGTGEWGVAGSAAFAEDGFSFVVEL